MLFKYILKIVMEYLKWNKNKVFMSQNDSLWTFKRLNVGIVHICPNFQKTKQKFWNVQAVNMTVIIQMTDKMYFALIP